MMPRSQIWQASAGLARPNLSSGRRGTQFRLGGRLLLLCVGLSVLTPRILRARLVTDQTGRRVNVPENPQRLVSLAPSITETLYALGLADRVVGDTDFCDYPPEAREKPHVGSVINPSLEEIVALKPDLVLGTAEANRRQTADQLERLGIPLYGLTAHTVDETLNSIVDLGRILGCEAAARRLVGDLRRRVQRVETEVSGKPRPKVLFVVDYRPLITAGPRTFVADVIRRAGGASITDDQRTEWPRLSLEEVLERDPEVILLPRVDTFWGGLELFSRLRGWRELRAVKAHRIYFVSETAIRPSPRLIDALEEMAQVLHAPAPADSNAGAAR